MRLAKFILAGGLLGAAALPAMADVFDGNWRVSVITERGQCDRGYAYEVAVHNGRVAYNGQASIDLSGTVASNGVVQVSIRKGGQHAEGAGRLNKHVGAGTWHGRGNGGDCMGRWEAERR